MNNIIKEQLPYTLDAIHLNNLGRHYKGKVRDNYYFDNKILMVTSDRVSAFDHVLGTIPFKGQILTDIASFWFDKTKDIVPNHYIKSIDPQVLLVKEAKPLPVEVIVRKYITGSVWRDYKNSKHHVYDLDFESDLIKNQRFNQPILTPTTKEDYGLHDQPISREEIIDKGYVDKDIYELAEKDGRIIASEEKLPISPISEVNVIGNVWDITSTLITDEVRLAGGSIFCSAKVCDGTNKDRELFIDRQTGNINIGFSVIVK